MPIVFAPNGGPNIPREPRPPRQPPPAHPPTTPIVVPPTPPTPEEPPPAHFNLHEWTVRYRFETHYHPYATELMRRLLGKSVPGLQAADTEYVKKPDGTPETLPDGKDLPVLYNDALFDLQHFRPSGVVDPRLPVEELDFAPGGAYSDYNWELFFHAPLTIAIHLSRNQRYAEAQQWLHYIFDPTDDGEGEAPARFWKVRPFRTNDVRTIEALLVNLSSAEGADTDLRDQTISSIEAWKDRPFRPHLIARYRPQAYMYKTVMTYLDNLIAWGDSLFRQDTGESVDEALMLYVLAAGILGSRPQAVPEKGSIRPQTYANLRADLSTFGNVLRDLQADVPFNIVGYPSTTEGDGPRLAALHSIGKSLYFCVPRNDKLLGYWDTVADRLFKIRNSLNLQGVFRQLPLFEPPLDPALLARAAASGLDVGAIVNGLNQPLPLVRFQLLVQKAGEICQEVKAFGNSLLSAMEKEDGEALAVLRSRHERVVMAMAENIRYGQVQEAKKAREGLLATLGLAVQRYAYYEQQLGRKPDEIVIPELAELDRESLRRMKFSMSDPEVGMRDIPIDIAPSLNASGGKIISSHESREIEALGRARALNEVAGATEKIAASLALIPEFGLEFAFWGVGGNQKFGGTALSHSMSLLASFARTGAEGESYESGNAARINGFARREQEWAFQSNLAAGEINQIFKQLRAAQIREAVAEQELASHRQQMKHAEEIEHFLNEEGSDRKGKSTNRALYTWMKREVKGLYAQSFQLAFDTARKAERALQHELGDPGLRYLQFGYLAGKEGLLAGERLHLDLRRMEMAFHDLNRREYELTRHVSLLQVDPVALLQLRTTGQCRVTLPEELFDLDGPGHHFRRIKSVAVSIPAVTGPYTSINCTLTLLKSSIRVSPALHEPAVYAREAGEDDRFNDFFGSLQSIVTSSGQNDSGMFETNLHDERYLPFEGAGVVSEWRLELPANPQARDPRQFDYETISDVILHLRYTARDGGTLLRRAALDNLTALMETAKAAGCTRLFSVRHEFPVQWSQFVNQQPSAEGRFPLPLTLRTEHYPFWAQGQLHRIDRIELFARHAGGGIDVTGKAGAGPGAGTLTASLTPKPQFGGLVTGTVGGIPPTATPAGELDLSFDTKQIDDLWLALTWKGGS